MKSWMFKIKSGEILDEKKKTMKRSYKESESKSLSTYNFAIFWY